MKKAEKMRMTFKCRSCGANPVAIDFDGDGPDAKGTCRDCGQSFGTRAQISREVKMKAAQHVQREVQDSIDAGRVIRKPR